MRPENVETVKVGDVLLTPHGEYVVRKVRVGDAGSRSGRMPAVVVEGADPLREHTWELRTGVGCSVGVVRRVVDADG